MHATLTFERELIQMIGLGTIIHSHCRCDAGNAEKEKGKQSTFITRNKSETRRF